MNESVRDEEPIKMISVLCEETYVQVGQQPEMRPVTLERRITKYRMQHTQEINEGDAINIQTVLAVACY